MRMSIVIPGVVAAVLASGCQKPATNDKPAAAAQTRPGEVPALPAGPAQLPELAPAGEPLGSADPGVATEAARLAAAERAAAAQIAAAAATASPAAERQAVALMQQMADIFVDGAKDCDKLGADLKRFITQNRASLGQMSAMLTGLSEPEQAAFEARNKAAQLAVGQRMQAGVIACGQHASVQAAMREFPTN
jgi:hypothetical protein